MSQQIFIGGVQAGIASYHKVQYNIVILFSDFSSKRIGMMTLLLWFLGDDFAGSAFGIDDTYEMNKWDEQWKQVAISEFPSKIEMRNYFTLNLNSEQINKCLFIYALILFSLSHSLSRLPYVN